MIKRSVKLNYDYSLKRSVSLKVRVTEDVKMIKLDLKRMKQIMSNLIANAVKYSPEHSEVIVAARNATEGSKKYLEISVSDHGFGMTEDQVKTAFQKYSTIQNPNSGKVDSFGMGLPIAKQLVELQSGENKYKIRTKQRHSNSPHISLFDVNRSTTAKALKAYCNQRLLGGGNVTQKFLRKQKSSFEKSSKELFLFKSESREPPLRKPSVL